LFTTNLQNFCHVGKLLYPFILGYYIIYDNLRNLNYFYLPYIARSDVYRELDDVVYDGNNNVLTEAQRIELQAALNNGNATPPSGGRIPNVH